MMDQARADAGLPVCCQASFPQVVVKTPHVLFLATVPGDEHCDRARREAAQVVELLAPFVVMEVDLKASPVLAARYGVQAVPTYWFWIDRTLVGRYEGVLDAAALVEHAAAVAGGSATAGH